MSVKRALNLDTKDNPSEETPLKTRKENLKSYSPTTGTCEMSPFSSPVSHNAQNLRNHSSNDGAEENDSESILSRRGQPQTEEDAFMELQSKVKSSLVRILKIRANLTSLQALEGSKELENITGVSDLSCDLRAELQKTQALLGDGWTVKPQALENLSDQRALRLFSGGCAPAVEFMPQRVPAATVV